MVPSPRSYGSVWSTIGVRAPGLILTVSRTVRVNRNVAALTFRIRNDALLISDLFLTKSLRNSIISYPDAWAFFFLQFKLRTPPYAYLPPQLPADGAENRKGQSAAVGDARAGGRETNARVRAAHVPAGQAVRGDGRAGAGRGARGRRAVHVGRDRGRTNVGPHEALAAAERVPHGVQQLRGAGRVRTSLNLARPQTDIGAQSLHQRSANR